MGQKALMKRVSNTEPQSECASLEMKGLETETGQPLLTQNTCEKGRRQLRQNGKRVAKREFSPNGGGPRERLLLSPQDGKQDDSISSPLQPEATKKKGNKLAKRTAKINSREEFEVKYKQLEELGAGGQGRVFAGYRSSDHLPVAIKYIPQREIVRCGRRQNGRKLPLEVVVMMEIAKSRSVSESAAISLLDYFDLGQELILILERPDSVVALFDYIRVNGRPLMEEEAKHLMKQLIEASLELQQHSIFHRDIKVENILVETNTDYPRLRIIDFGFSCFTKKRSLYRNLCGTKTIAPPECFEGTTYTSGPYTVWQLGVVLFEMLNENFDTKLFLEKELSFNDDLSVNCLDLLELCLAVNPRKRPSLKQLQCHLWFT